MGLGVIRAKIGKGETSGYSDWGFFLVSGRLLISDLFMYIEPIISKIYHVLIEECSI